MFRGRRFRDSLYRAYRWLLDLMPNPDQAGGMSPFLVLLWVVVLITLIEWLVWHGSPPWI